MLQVMSEGGVSVTTDEPWSWDITTSWTVLIRTENADEQCAIVTLIKQSMWWQRRADTVRQQCQDKGKPHVVQTMDYASRVQSFGPKLVIKRIGLHHQHAVQ